jgi:ferric-dicitrate binding protein FerR (iron transport regulator)
MIGFGRQRNFGLLLALSICGFLLGISPDASAQSVVGSVKSVAGQGSLARGSQQLDLSIGMNVELRDLIQTARGARAIVDLNDGSEISIAGETRLVVENGPTSASPAGGTALSLLVGKVRSVVKPLTAGRPDFVVTTPNAVAGVRGTDFEISFIEGRPCPGFPTCLRYTDVGVYKGIVEVRNPTNPAAAPVRLVEGQETNVPCELAPTAPAPLGMMELGAPGYH